MKKSTLGLVLVALVLTLAVTGCAQLAQQAVQKATGVSVDKNGSQITVTGPNGQKATVQGDQNKLPDGLPDTVPAYSGTVKGSTALTTDKGSTFTFVVHTGDDVATVAAWYKSHLVDKGWKVDAVISGGTASILTAKMGGSSIQITVTPSSSGSGTDVATVANIVK